MWIHIAEIVCRRTCKTRHSIELDREDGLIVDKSLVNNLLVCFIPSPDLSIAQWRLTSLSRQELIHLWKFDRQTLLWNHCWDAVLVIYREWLTPVTLTREDSITKTVVNLHTTNTMLLNKYLCCLDSFLNGHAIENEAFSIIFNSCLAWGRGVANNTLLSIV